MRLFLLLSFLFFYSFLSAQDVSNKGRDFWIAYPAHIDGLTSQMGIYITSDVATTGTITAAGQTVSFTLAANQVVRKYIGGASADIPNTQVHLSQQDGIAANAGIRIQSAAPIAVYAHIINSARSGATLALPVSVWGKEYLVPSMDSRPGGGAWGYGEVAVLAAEANTTVEITPVASSRNGARTPGQPYTIVLANPGDAYQVQFQQGQDITGTLIRSVAAAGSGCKPITVFSATTWSAFDCIGASGGDNLFQQLFPVAAFGKRFLTAPFRNRQFDLVRIIGRNPNALVSVTRNGVTTNTTLGTGITINTFDPLSISSTDPVSVIQYITSQTCSNGCTTAGNSPASCHSDPEMVVLSPVEQTVNNITVYSAHRNFVPGGNSNVNQNFLNVIIRTAAAPSFRINGLAPAQGFVAIPGTGYSYLQADVSASAAAGNSQNLTADSAFSAIAYGYGNVESYGYNAGTNVRDLYQFASIRNDSATVDFPATCVGTPFSFSITFPYQPTSLIWDFNNSGLLSPNATITNNSPVADSSFVRDGRTLYVYRLPGKYTATATGSIAVKITANNPSPDGCSGIQEINYPINVFERPTARFSIASNGCLSDSVRFTDASTSGGRVINKFYWTFGDNTGSIEKNPSKLYSASGSYNVRLLTINDIGCVDDTITTVTLGDLPVARLRISNPQCENSPILFTDSSTIATGSIAQYIFDNGNGTKDTSTTALSRSVTYPLGNYTASLQVISNGGCVSQPSPLSFAVNHRPRAGFTLPEVCLNDAIAIFTDTSKIEQGSIVRYKWFYGDAARSTPANPDSSAQQNGQHRYTATGNYTVTQMVTSALGCADTAVQTLTVNGAVPRSAFRVLAPAGRLCANEEVTLQNNSSVDFGSITQLDIYWDFLGAPTTRFTDSTPTPAKLYTHRYPVFHTATARQFTVRVVAYSGTACLSTRDTIITVNPAPKAAFSPIPSICAEAAPRLITQGRDSAALGGSFVYSGNAGLQPVGLFSPALTGPGTFAVRYLTTSPAGCSDSAASSIVVLTTPVATLQIGASTCARNDISIAPGLSSTAGRGIQYAYSFAPGRDSVLTSDNPFSIRYPAAGPATVSLRITTDSGCVSNLATASFTVHPLPSVSFVLPLAVCLPLGEATFTNTTTISDGSTASLQYLWNFGDVSNPNPSVARNPTFRYSSQGAKQVTLTVTSNQQCVDSASQLFTNIFAAPVAVATASVQVICAGATVNFSSAGSNSANGSIVSQRWIFGDGAQSNAANASNVYRSGGQYQATLQVTDDKGCASNVATVPVTVYNFPQVNAGPDLFVLEGGRQQINASATGQGLRFRWSPSAGLDRDTVLKPITSPAMDMVYTLTATGLGNCSSSDNVVVKRLQLPQIPSAFSPNGDGINDLWIINYLNSYPGCRVEVYDRWGALIFESRGYGKPWDGTRNGTALPIGTYYYIVDPKNGLSKLSGSVTILK